MVDKKRIAKPGGVKAHPRLDEAKRPGAREPIRAEKLDRNAPCSCGSGKKYKKCCAGGTSLWAKVKGWVKGLLPGASKTEKST